MIRSQRSFLNREKIRKKKLNREKIRKKNLNRGKEISFKKREKKLFFKQRKYQKNNSFLNREKIKKIYIF